MTGKQFDLSEKRLATRLFLLGFLAVGVTSVFTSTAANTLFLSNYDASALAYCYLGFAVVTPLVGTCYLRLQERWGLRKLILVALAADIVTLLVFRAGLALGWDRLFSFGLKIWYDAELVLTSIVFWGLANQLLTVRQGKRLFGIIGAGDPIAVILGGAAIPVLLNWLSPADLVVLSALGAAAAMIVVCAIFARASSSAGASDETFDDALADQRDLKPLFRDRYVLMIFAAACLSLFCYFLVDNAFYAEAKNQFPKEADLARFLGLYMAVAGAVSLLSAVVITGPLVSRFGVRIGLLVLPSLLLCFSLAATGSAGLSESAAILFACVSANRVFDFALRGTVDKSSMLAIYQPLPSARRLRVQTAVEMMVEPFAAAVAGIGLLVLMNMFGWGARELTVLISSIACVWLGTLAFVHREYIGELGRALATRRLERVPVETEEHLALVEQGLNSQRAGEVLYCLHLLIASGRQVDPNRLQQLLAHESSDVRLAVARAMEKQPNPIFVETIRRHLRESADTRVNAALLGSWLACAPKAIEEVVPFLEHAALRNGAIVALLRHRGMEGSPVAADYLMALVGSQRPDEREQAAGVIAAIASPLSHPLLAQLLNDLDTSVRRAALKAAAVIGAPSLLPIIIAQVEITGLERGAQAALIVMGEKCLPAIDAALAQGHLSVRCRLRLLEVLSRIGGPAAQARILTQITASEWRMRLAVHSALARCGCACPRDAEEQLWTCIQDLIAGAAWALAAAEDMPAGSQHFDALKRSLNRQVEKSVAAIFHLLSCLAPKRAIDDAREAFLRGPASKRAYALETIEQVLPVAVRVQVMALLEPPSAEERRKRLCRYFPQPALRVEKRLADIVSTNDRVCPWTAALALFAMLKSDIRLPLDSAVLAARFDDPAVHEVLEQIWPTGRVPIVIQLQPGSGDRLA